MVEWSAFYLSRYCFKTSIISLNIVSLKLNAICCVDVKRSVTHSRVLDFQE